MTHYRRLKEKAARARDRWKRFAASKKGRRVLKGLRIVLTLGIVAYLVFRLAGIGWEQVWTSLPRTPWFYVIFVGIYLTLPLFQAAIFGLIWKRPTWQLLGATLKKRVYDKDVMSYSGDVYLYFWARQHTGFSDRRLLHNIKDNAIVSSVTSTIVAFGLLGAFLLGGMIELPEAFARHSVAYTLGAVIIGGAIVGLGIRFRHVVLKLAGRLLLAVAGLHLLRLLIVQGLQILQWNVVIPEVALQVWFTFLAAQIIVSRIPLLPSRDLIFVGAGIELAAAVQVPAAAVAGMLLVHSVLDKTLNLLLFTAVSIMDRRKSSSIPSDLSRTSEKGATAPVESLQEGAASSSPAEAPSRR